VKAAGAQRAVILAVETQGAPVQIEAQGAQVLGTVASGARTVTLIRVTEAGLKLLTLHGSGDANLRIDVAGDLDRDGDVDGADGAAWEQGGAAADLNGSGAANADDRQVLYANYGWRANQAPVALPVTGAALKTHTELAARRALDAIAVDPDGDRVYWRHGAAVRSRSRLQRQRPRGAAGRRRLCRRTAH
jgi:hypothetical protein